MTVASNFQPRAKTLQYMISLMICLSGEKKISIFPAFIASVILSEMVIMSSESFLTNIITMTGIVRRNLCSA